MDFRRVIAFLVPRITIFHDFRRFPRSACNVVTVSAPPPHYYTIGNAPKGGLYYGTFREKLNEVQRYNRKTGEDGPKLTLKSLVDDDLKAGMEGRCGLPKHCWNSVNDKKHPGMTEEEFVNAVRKSLKPARKADFKSAQEGMMLTDRGQKRSVLAARAALAWRVM